MIEKNVINYLQNEMGVPVYAEEPAKPPKEYLLVEKMGSSEENLIKTAQIAVQSYGESLLQAAELNETVKEAMRDMITLDNISKCGCNSDYNYTDTATKRYRYQALFNIVYYDMKES